MSWDQSYSVPSFECLLERLAGISGTQLLIDHLEAKGLKIVDVKDVVLADGMYENVKGTKIVLSDSRVYIPKLVEKVTANGNSGNDIYEWYLIGDEPEVIHTDLSEPIGVSTPEEFVAAEADLVSDGVLESETIPAFNSDFDYENDDSDGFYSDDGCNDGCGCGD